MKILVTGGAGYVGVKLVARLLEDGHTVVAFDKFLYGYEPILFLHSHQNFRVVNGDIREITSDSVEGFDVVYHLAGISGYPACEANPHSARNINVDGTQRLVDSLNGDQLLIYASTTSFYGDSGGVCDETSKIRVVSLYGLTKYQAEKIARLYDNSISLRFATIFGVSPRMRTDLLVNDFVYKAINDRTLVLFDGKSKRTFLHIDDAVEAYILALKNADSMKGQVYNVGDSEMNFSKLEIAEAIREFVDYTIIDSDVADFDKRDFLISFDKIRALGFRKTRTLQDGIRELVRLYSFYRPHVHYRPV